MTFLLTDARDQPGAERVDVLDSLVGDHGTVEVADDLVHVDDGPALIVLGELPRLHLWVDGLELPRPVVAHLLMTAHASAVDRTGPVDIGVEGREGCLEVAGVEGGVAGADEVRASSLQAGSAANLPFVDQPR
jgi:hypothetical protein